MKFNKLLISGALGLGIVSSGVLPYNVFSNEARAEASFEILKNEDVLSNISSNPDNVFMLKVPRDSYMTFYDVEGDKYSKVTSNLDTNNYTAKYYDTDFSKKSETGYNVDENFKNNYFLTGIYSSNNSDKNNPNDKKESVIDVYVSNEHVTPKDIIEKQPGHKRVTFKRGENGKFEILKLEDIEAKEPKKLTEKDKERPEVKNIVTINDFYTPDMDRVFYTPLIDSGGMGYTVSFPALYYNAKKGEHPIILAKSPKVLNKKLGDLGPLRSGTPVTSDKYISELLKDDKIRTEVLKDKEENLYRFVPFDSYVGEYENNLVMVGTEADDLLTELYLYVVSDKVNFSDFLKFYNHIPGIKIDLKDQFNIKKSYIPYTAYKENSSVENSVNDNPIVTPPSNEKPETGEGKGASTGENINESNAGKDLSNSNSGNIISKSENIILDNILTSKAGENTVSVIIKDNKNYSLTVNDTTEENKDFVLSKINDTTAKVKVFDLELLENGKSVKSDKLRTVKVALVEDLTNKDVSVYYIDKSNDIFEFIKSEVSNNVVTFETDHFSNYGIVISDKNSNVSANNMAITKKSSDKKLPNTGQTTNNYAVVAILSVAMLALKRKLKK